MNNIYLAEVIEKNKIVLNQIESIIYSYMKEDVQTVEMLYEHLKDKLVSRIVFDENKQLLLNVYIGRAENWKNPNSKDYKDTALEHMDYISYYVDFKNKALTIKEFNHTYTNAYTSGDSYISDITFLLYLSNKEITLAFECDYSDVYMEAFGSLDILSFTYKKNRLVYSMVDDYTAEDMHKRYGKLLSFFEGIHDIAKKDPITALELLFHKKELSQSHLDYYILMHDNDLSTKNNPEFFIDYKNTIIQFHLNEKKVIKNKP